MRLLIAALFLPLCALGAVRGNRAEYVGGTVSTIKQGTQGTLDLYNTKILRFHHEGAFELPYARIQTLEFGQKVGRRVGASIAGMAALGLPGLIILASKKKKHFLTIGFADESGAAQAAIFELAKDTVDSVLATVRARTGKPIEVTDQGVPSSTITGHAPEPPPLPPVPTILKIESVPAGAIAVVNGNEVGLTPVTVKPDGTVAYVLVRKDGFARWTRDVPLKPGEIAVIAELKAEGAAMVSPQTGDSPNVIVFKPGK